MTPPSPPVAISAAPLAPAQEGAGEVDVDDALPLGQAHLLRKQPLLHLDQHAVAQYAGAVDEAVQGPELILDGGEGRLDLRLAGHVADEQGAAAVTAAHLRLGHLQIGAVDVDERKLRPLLRQTQGDGAAQPPARPRDGDDFLFDIH